MTIALIKPSTLLPQGLRLERTANLTLFKFTEALGDRMQVLLDQDLRSQDHWYYR